MNDDVRKLVEIVASLDFPASEAGWPMGRYCKMCEAFAAYIPEEPPRFRESGEKWSESEWDEYRRVCDERITITIAAIPHTDNCGWVLARKLKEMLT